MDQQIWAVYRKLTAGDEKRHWAFVPARAFLRWVLVFYRQLERDRAFMKAAGMAYASLVAIVPALMLVYGLLRGSLLFSAEAGDREARVAQVEDLIFGTFLGDIPEVRAVLLPGLLQVDLAALGIVGVASLLVVAARLFLMVERAYNDIFGVVIDRGIGMRLLNFYVALTAVPFAILLAFVGADELGGVGSLRADTINGAVQFALLLGALKIFPCTKVRWRAALVGTAVSWGLLQLLGRGFPLYLHFFASDDPLRVIYGSLALIPVFLLWFYLLWVVVLLGVEVAYIAQNFTSLVQAELELWEQRRAVVRAPSVDVALEVAALVAWHFGRGDGPVDGEEIARGVRMKEKDVHVVLRVLEQGGILLKTESGWTLGRPADHVRIAEIVDAWRRLTALRALGESRVAGDVATALHEKLEGTLAEAAQRWVEPEAQAQGG